MKYMVITNKERSDEMFKANEIYKRNLTNLINSPYSTNGQKVRPKYADGTPSHTKYINNVTDTYDISKGEFPISNYRPLAWKSAIKELLWIFSDQSNDLNLLEDKYGVHYWNDWQIEDSDSETRTIGQRYGATIKKYDLMNKLLKGLKEEPYSRRHIMNMYQYTDFEESAGLNPCVYESIWNVRGEYLDVFINQRSSDYVTSEGVNRVQYCALLLMVAKAIGLKPGLFTWNVCNMHLYDRHEEQVRELLSRTPVNIQPVLILNTDKTDFYSFTVDDFELIDFEAAGEQLKFELAI